MSEPTPLKSGEWTSDVRLDRTKQVDLRSLNYSVSDVLTAAQQPRSFTWFVDERLDQGHEGACVGFGVSLELAAQPVEVSGVTNEFARQLYWSAQQLDGQPGGSYPGATPVYEGTSTLAGMQAARAAGYITSYRWALNLDDLVLAVGYQGPAVIGIDWYEPMFHPDANGFVHPTGKIAGGHCICIIGVQVETDAHGAVDPVASYFLLQNSWGPTWGIDGRCKVSFVDMAVLFPGGDFAIPMGRRLP
jgi:hypothetical protein